MSILDELERTAWRYDKWRQVQDAARNSEVAQRMQRERQRFDGSRYIGVDDRVFFEQIIEGDDLMPIRYFELGRLAATPVGRIRIDLGSTLGEGYATGFLVAPGVLMTNWHVLKSPEFARAATVSFDAEDDVRGLPKPQRVFTLRPSDLYVSDEELDFCVVAVAPTTIDGAGSIEAFGYLRLFGQTGKITRDEYATIFQHPRGRQKQAAVRNNKIVVYVYDQEADAPDNNFLYYATDTLHGSSGAPVLSDQFFVVALHRRGVPRTRDVRGRRVVLRKDGTPAREGDPGAMIDYIANEGVRVSKILQRLDLRSKTEPIVARASQLIAEAAGRVDQGPFWVPAAPPIRQSAAVTDDLDLLEIVHRKVEVFENAPGYQSDFLPGFEIGLPEPDDDLAAQLAPRTDGVAGNVLEFAHFSTAVHATRRMPVYAAINLDGRAKATMASMPRRPSWSYDPRIAEDHQLDDSIFSSMLQRGHMAARDFVYWGDDAGTADVHSFTLTNVCPQIGAFNGNREWAQLERRIVNLAVTSRQRVTVLAGPILKRQDPLYDDLRGPDSSALVGTGIRLAQRFWYIVAWVDAGELKVRPFLLDQEDDIDAAGPLEIDLQKPELVKDTTLAKITSLTRLTFPGLQ